MNQVFLNLLRKLRDYLDRICAPYADELVLALVLHTASLELAKGEFIELAPLKGCTGPFQLSGNSLPVIEYMMFEKHIMEFVQVRVEISRPDKIRFITTIYAKKESSTTPERHGEEIETTDRHKEPFNRLALYLFRYFGHYVSPLKRLGRPSYEALEKERDELKALMDKKNNESILLHSS